MLNSKLGRLLIVDDEIETLTPLCDLLSEWGYEVAGYTSPKDALKELKEKEFDLLMTDLVMPEMDGIELIQAAMKTDPHLVSIIITGKGTIQTAVEAIKNGAFDYLLKPIEWKMLRPVLSRAIEVRRLRKSEERYRSIVEDYQTELICRFLPDGTLTFVNEPCCLFLNKKRGELIGHNFLPFILEEDKEIVRRHISSLNSEHPVGSIENRVINPKGEIYWYRWTTRIIFDKHVNFIEFQAVGRDITERKQMEEALRESEERYRTIIEQSADSIYLADVETRRILEANESFQRLLGYTLDEIPRLSVYDFVVHEKEDIDDKINQLLKGHSYFLGERRYLRKDGTLVDVEVSLSLTSYKGRSAFCVFARDITERKQAEKLLKESENKYKTLADNALVGIYKTTLNGDILYVNEALLKMLEYDSPEEFLSINSMTTYKFPNDRKLLIENLKKTGRVRDFETELFTKNRRAKNFILNATLEGDVISGMMLDINERKQAEEARRKYLERLKILSYRLLEVQEAERRYIAKELHDEIGQTLTSLKLSIDMLSRSPTENITDSLSDLQAEVGKLLSQVRNMSLDLRPSMLDDLGLLPALLWHFERFTAQTNIRVLFKHSGLDKRFIPEVETVAYRIVQEGLTNVARHAGINEATVMVTTKQDKLVIQVKDKGAGFDFNAVISSEKAAGLHGMEERLTLLGGKLTIKSSPGAGTRLTAEIPIEDSV